MRNLGYANEDKFQSINHCIVFFFIREDLYKPTLFKVFTSTLGFRGKEVIVLPSEAASSTFLSIVLIWYN